MRRIPMFALAAVAALGVATATPAQADWQGGRGEWNHGHGGRGYDGWHGGGYRRSYGYNYGGALIGGALGLGLGAIYAAPPVIYAPPQVIYAPPPPPVYAPPPGYYPPSYAYYPPAYYQRQSYVRLPVLPPPPHRTMVRPARHQPAKTPPCVCDHKG